MRWALAAVLLLLLSGACVAALAWRQAALPGEARVIKAIERTFGAVRGDLQEAAARWSVAAPGQRLQIDRKSGG